MLSPLAGFLEREILGVFKVAAATSSGVAVGISAADTAPLNPSPYGNSFGTVAAASPAVSFTQSGTTPFAVTGMSVQREIGFLLQPVTTNGPSILSVLAQVYDESVPQGQTAAVLLGKAGALIATDQYSTGTGAITFGGAVALGTICGINAGLARVQQAGDAPRLVFLGKVVQRTLPLAVFQII